MYYETQKLSLLIIELKFELKFKIKIPKLLEDNFFIDG